MTGKKGQLFQGLNIIIILPSKTWLAWPLPFVFLVNTVFCLAFVGLPLVQLNAKKTLLFHQSVSFFIGVSDYDITQVWVKNINKKGRIFVDVKYIDNFETKTHHCNWENWQSQNTKTPKTFWNHFKFAVNFWIRRFPSGGL